MTMRPSRLIERARSSRPVTLLTLLGVLLLPAALGGVFVTALQDPSARLGEMTAAIVNLDEPVTIDGQLAPLGRQLSAGLVDGTGDEEGSNLNWVISNASDASAGLADGTYQAVVTIPKDFSTSATSGSRGLQDEDVDAEKARISVNTAPEARVADGLITNQIAAAAAATMGSTLSETTLQNVLVGFTTINERIGDAAAGATQLAAGAKDAAAGAAKLPGGATQIASGAGELSSGASRLASGLDALAQGARDAQSGAGQLAAGLNGGADQLAAQGIVPAPVVDAAAAAAQASAGTAEGVGGLAQGLRALPCDPATTPDLCTAISTLVGQADSVQQAAAGAAQAAAGASGGIGQVAAQAPGAIAQQMRAAGAAADQLAGGIGQLTGGIGQSEEGAQALSSGAGSLQTGAAQLADGATALSGGLAGLSSGTAGLASGLDQAVASLPTYTDSRASSLASAVASPVQADGATSLFGPTAIPLLTAVVLWFGALASFIVMRALTATALTSRRSSAALALRALLPAAAIGAGQGVLVSLIVQTIAGYDAAQWWGFTGAAVLAGVAFAAVNQALVAVLGGGGRWIGALVGVTAIAAGIISTLPGWLASVAGFLPTAPAVTALLGEDGIGGAVAGLVTWAVLSVVATTLAVARRRTTTAAAVLATA